MDIQELVDLKANQVKSLREAGFNTIEAVGTATISELMDVPNIGEATAKKLWRKCQEHLFPKQFVKASDLQKREHNIKHLTTGSKAFDSLLGGGFETQSISEVAGAYGVGKTELAFQLTVNTFLPVEKGGLNKDGEVGVLFIDTEKTFRSRRIAQLAEAKGLKPKNVLDGVIYAEAYSTDHQIFLLNHSDDIIKKNNVKLIIIDSLLAHFRSEYVGREMLAPRQQNLNKHLRKLQRLARAFNCVALITNQAIADPTFFGTLKPTGGNIVAHASTTRVWLKRPKPMESVRIASLRESPWLPSGEVVFLITEKGVADKDSLNLEKGD